MPKFDERLARQYRYEPPSGFPLTSPCSGIVHHLSGPSRHARTQTSHRGSKSVVCARLKNPNYYFHSAGGFRNPATCGSARLLGPCFKTGRRGPFYQRPNRRALSNHTDNYARSLGLQTQVVDALYPRDSPRSSQRGDAT